MLFLAVFCGFLAENQREHIIEHQRAKVYATNLYEELKKDTSRLNSVSLRHKEIAGKLDTLCMLIKDKTKNATNGMLYYYGTAVTQVEFFSSSNTTIEQLKGSGNLRIMSNALAYKISEYDKLIRELEKEYGISKSEFIKMEDIHFRVFDMYFMESVFTDSKAPRDSLFNISDYSIKNDPDLIKEYTGWLKFEAGIYRYQVDRYLVRLQNSAIELLAFLKKEYHLD